MKSAPIEIPKGNTQPGVLVKVFKMLSRELPLSSSGKLHVFDLPCGEGEFLITFKKFYPQSDLVGLDLFAKPRADFQGQFIQSDMRDWSQIQGSSFDLVTCISGVMQCDDVQGLFEKSSKHLKPGGYFLVTNDNILTARDRFSFFLFGYVKRFRKFFGPHEGNWNVVLPQSLLRLYERHGFEDVKIEYCSLRPEDWLFLPLALPLYLLDLLYLFVSKSPWSKAQRYQMYPFLSLFARHYIFIGRLKN
jgi:SAM-dependent methyltransferase